MEQNEQKAQEMYMEYQMLDQHIKKLQSQIETLANQLMEATATKNSLDEFDKIKSGREIFVPVSSGIFVKAEIKNTSELLINVGAGAVVQKDLPSAKKLVSTQIEEMKKVHEKLLNELERMAGRAAEIEGEIQKIMPQ